MLPHEHFAVAFLPILIYVGVRDRGLPSLRLVWIAFIGSQWPDLIDKPLATYTGLIPTGRVFMHSLLFALPVSALAIAYARTTGQNRAGYVFTFAYLTHIFSDHYPGVLRSGSQAWWDLLWPLTPANPRPAVPHWAGPDRVYVTLWTAVSLVILSIATVTFLRDFGRHFGSKRRH